MPTYRFAIGVTAIVAVVAGVIYAVWHLSRVERDVGFEDASPVPNSIPITEGERFNLDGVLLGDGWAIVEADDGTVSLDGVEPTRALLRGGTDGMRVLLVTDHEVLASVECRVVPGSRRTGLPECTSEDQMPDEWDVVAASPSLRERR